MTRNLTFSDSRDVAVDPCADWLRCQVVRLASCLGVKWGTLAGRPARGRMGVLLYDRIACVDSRFPAPAHSVSPGQFARQIQGLLSTGFVFWPLRKILSHRDRGWAIPPYVTCLTFDDGYSGVYHHAWPLLRELRIPATLFVATAYLDSPEPLPFDAWGREHANRVDPTAYLPLTSDQCREMVATGLVDLGCHTHSHFDFRGHPDLLEADIRASLPILRSLTGQAAFPFAYPYGNPRLGFLAEEQVDAARQSGVLCGLHSGNELIRPRRDPFSWGRLRAYRWDHGASLAAKLSGWCARRHSPTSRSTAFQTVPSGLASGETTAATVPLGPTSTDFPPAHISVVIPTFNRASWLADSLDSIVNQDPAGEFTHEILVVDNASTDGTPEVVREKSARSSVPIRYLRQESPGDAPTRNAGCRAAAGEWVAFFDDDQLAPPHWLRELLKGARRVDGAILGGPVRLDLSAEQRAHLGVLGRRALRELVYDHRLQPYVGNVLPGTGNALVARWVFDRLGLFDESMRSGGSDTDFFARARRAGIPLWFVPDAGIHHRISPHRLTDEFLRWDAMIGGASQAAHLDLKERGRRGVLLVCITRLAQALAWNLPLLAWGRWRGDATEVLGRRLLLWRAQGYLRQTLSILAPHWFPQRRFFDWLDFRNSRVVGVPDQLGSRRENQHE